MLRLEETDQREAIRDSGARRRHGSLPHGEILEVRGRLPAATKQQKIWKIFRKFHQLLGVFGPQLPR